MSKPIKHRENTTMEATRTKNFTAGALVGAQPLTMKC